MTSLKRIIPKYKLLPLDLGGPNVSIILAGMGRSGTTWVGNLINHDDKYRILFEPFSPEKIEEARVFRRIQYLNASCDDVSLINQAKIILSGKIRNRWVERDNNRLVYHHRMLKDIRCNLMLGWLRSVANNPPVVLTVRHPLQVASSWRQLGWAMDVQGNRTGVSVITSQTNLLQDYPIINDVMQQINLRDFVESMVFQWCVFHLVPSSQLKKSDAHVLYYENLLNNFKQEMTQLFAYLNKTLPLTHLTQISATGSSTNFLQRSHREQSVNLFNGWKENFSTRQIQRANYILDAFEMGDIYDSQGYPTGRNFLKQ